MIKTNKFLGSILLISGTTIGAGMLGLPVTTGFAGFFPTLFVLLFFWGYMLITAFLYLEANLSVKGNVNLITMAEHTLGFWGKAVAWVFYLLLLYSLTAAYMAGSAPLFTEAIKYFTGYTLPVWAGPLPLVVIFGIFVYLGSASSDYINRILMFGLIAAYLVLAILLPSHTDFDLIKHVDSKALVFSFPILLTSYGFHIIIPTLTNYMRHDVKKMKLALVIGSLIPFIIYVVWEFLVLGTVKVTGDNSLAQMYIEGQGSTAPLINNLINVLKLPWVAKIANIFSFCAIITSFIGVTLSLTDFLSDGFKIKRNKKGRFLACILTFLPPLIFLYGYQRVFLTALQFAGVFVAVLLCILPALMTWQVKEAKFYQSFKGRILLVVVILIALAIIGLDILEEMGFLKNLISGYLNKNV
ncbi:MAG TPA: tyrosine transporter [Chlamydiae bacterium]|nr:tyrosine transporter [Chlamydiota bacterium]